MDGNGYIAQILSVEEQFAFNLKGLLYNLNPQYREESV